MALLLSTIQDLDWLRHRVMPAEALQLVVEQLRAPLHEDRARLVVYNKKARQPAPAKVTFGSHSVRARRVPGLPRAAVLQVRMLYRCKVFCWVELEALK